VKEFEELTNFLLFPPSLGALSKSAAASSETYEYVFIIFFF